MLLLKTTSSILSLFLTSSNLKLAEIPFQNQTIQSSVTTPNNEKISNTFVDYKNTVWVVTSNTLYYKKAGENQFNDFSLQVVFPYTNSTNVFTKFAKINYSTDSSFFVYQSSLGMSDYTSPVYKISYNKNNPQLTTYDLSAKVTNITAIWADDRGVLVAGKDASTKNITLFSSTDNNLENLQKNSDQPDQAIFKDNCEITTLFRSDKNSSLKNSIIVSSSNVNPFSEQLIFPSDPSDTYIAGTNHDGANFTTYATTLKTSVFCDVTISKYSNNDTAYLLNGTSGDDGYYSVQIVAKDNSYDVLKSFNQENQCQTKNMGSIGNYVFMVSQNPNTQSYIQNGNIFYFQLTTPKVSTSLDPINITNKDTLNINNLEYLKKVMNVHDTANNDIFFYMPSFSTDKENNLYIGVDNTLMYLGTLPSAEPDLGKSLNTGLIVGLTVGVVGALSITGGANWYFLKKKKII